MTQIHIKTFAKNSEVQDV